MEATATGKTIEEAKELAAAQLGIQFLMSRWRFLKNQNALCWAN